MPHTNPFRGTYTALVTPFFEDRLDLDSLNALVEFQIEGGVDGLVAVGTTGESPTLSNEEHIATVATVVSAANQRVPVLAGTGSNSTTEAVELTRLAEKAGADGFLLVAPYYNKPSQEGLYRHFAAVAESTSLPILLYSIPSRCGVAIEAETCARLFEKYPHVSAIKEAGGQSARVSTIRRLVGNDFSILSGDDGLTIPFLALGATGLVSVASNAYPNAVSQMVKLALDDDFTKARELHYLLAPVFEAIFLEPNPVPIKFLLHHLGRIASEEVRLPLSPAEEKIKERIVEVSETYLRQSALLIS
ncbi:MAG: 4-hydroxy-tetrahydrodipicolinate synthase [Puniceicoccaceae bacterium]